MFWSAAVAFFGLLSAAAGQNGLPDSFVIDVELRMPFDETIECLSASAVEDHWVTSKGDLDAELFAELEKYLRRSLPRSSFTSLESVNVTLHKSKSANETEANQSFLRQSDYKANDCELNLELSGTAMLLAGAMDQTIASAVIEGKPDANAERSSIYSRVSDSIVEQYNNIINIDASLFWSIAQSESTPPSTPPATPMPPTTTPLPTPPTASSSFPCLETVEGLVTLSERHFFCSPNGKYKFGLVEDGDLALFDGDDSKVWSANTCCSGKVKARLQRDGNLVVRTDTGSAETNKVLWASHSGTKDLTVTSLIVGDDGIVTITDALYGHIWSSAIQNKDRVKADSLVGKVMAGYQGWFHAKKDGGMNKWFHWSRPQDEPAADTVTFDAWPDLQEFDDDELYPTLLSYEDGSNAKLYSAYNVKTVERHTRWMMDYGLHGVFAQRFIGNTRGAQPRNRVINTVLRHIRSGCEKYGRTFVNMWDISNGKEETVVEDIINDWKKLVDEEHITKSKQYLHHHGRPLVAIWGFGFYNRIVTPQQAAEVIDWFHNQAEDKYKATVMGGVPTGWRRLVMDSKIDPEWASVYRMFDVISPWAVGRFRDTSSATTHRRIYTAPDLAECQSLGIDYLPVVYPGFSFKNLKPYKPFNGIPRYGGEFMWHQMQTAVAAGNNMIYVAMFDEVDEGTAIFKIAGNKKQTPTTGIFLAADEDGYDCPGDWYLNITGHVAGLVQGGKDIPLDMPAYPS